MLSSTPHTYQSNRSLSIILLGLLTVVLSIVAADALEARQRPRSQQQTKQTKQAKPARQVKHARVRTSNKNSRTGSVSSNRKRRVRRPRTVVRNTKITALTQLKTILVGEGVRYTEYKTNGKFPMSVHALTMDRTVAGNAIRIVKGEDRADGLERIADMARRYDSISDHKLYGLVNANFWRAYRNTAIGACVVDGEVVELLPYKNWTSAFVDVSSNVVIDSFRLQGKISIKGRDFPISSVNRRIDSGVVVYNSFAGSTVPYINAKELEKAFVEAVKDTALITGDSTEDALSQESLRREILRAQQEANGEFPMVKIRVRHLRSPSVNVPYMCQILSVDTGSVDLPLRGSIISIPRTLLAGNMPRANDTITISYMTNVHTGTRFMNAVCGTPRLVRNGVPKPEHVYEGSTGKRFINHNLARTSIGVDKSGSKVMIVAIEPSQPEQRITGASLQQAASIMSLLGAHNAMNLDGGGSAGMCIGNDHMFWEGADPLTRRISVAFAFVKLSHVLKSVVSD